MAVKLIPNQPVPFAVLNLAGGKSSLMASQIRDNQADDLTNVWFEDGAEVCRPGQTKLYATSLGAGGVNLLDYYRKSDGSTTRLEHHTTKLYTQGGSNQPAELLTGLANAKSFPFGFNGKWYLVNGSDFIRYDGTTAVTVASVAYVPTLDQNVKPDGTGGTTKEKLNYLCNSFKRDFNGDNASVLYQLAFTGPTSVDEVKVGDVVKTVTTDYTVDLVNGTVTFVVAPATGQNNVTIQATKAGLMDATTITKNKRAVVYSDRILLIGDANLIYWSGLTGDYTVDGTYWPEDNWRIAFFDDYCTEFKTHNGELILLKEKSIEGMRYSLDTSGNAVFTWRLIYDSEACDMPDSVQTINNMIWFGHSLKGVGVLRSTVNENELNVDWISDNINGTSYKAGLLNEQVTNLKAATSVDDGKNYILCVGSKAYVCQYNLVPYTGRNKFDLVWKEWSGINAACWLVQDNIVYFGDRDNGLVQRLVPGQRNDNGTAISQMHRGKKFDFDTIEFLKTIRRAWIRIKAGANSTITVKFISDKEAKEMTISAASTNSFSFATARFDTWVFTVDNNDKIIALYPNIRNTASIQVEFSCSTVNEGLAIVGYEMQVILGKRVK